MTQYNSLNINLPNSQHDELKPGIKNGTEVTCEYEHFQAKQQQQQKNEFQIKNI